MHGGVRRIPFSLLDHVRYLLDGDAGGRLASALSGKIELRPWTYFFNWPPPRNPNWFQEVSVSLFDLGVFVRISFILYLRNFTYYGEFTWIGKLEMVCLSQRVDMCQIIFLEISRWRLNYLYYLNYSSIPLPTFHAKSLKPSIIGGFYDLSTWSSTILSTSMFIPVAGALRRCVIACCQQWHLPERPPAEEIHATFLPVKNSRRF